VAGRSGAILQRVGVCGLRDRTCESKRHCLGRRCIRCRAKRARLGARSGDGDVDDCVGAEYFVRGSAKMDEKVPLDPLGREAAGRLDAQPPLGRCKGRVVDKPQAVPRWSNAADERLVKSPSVATAQVRSGLRRDLDHWKETQSRGTANGTLTCSSRRRPTWGIGSVRKRRGRRQGAVALGLNPQASRPPAFSPTNAPRSVRHEAGNLSLLGALASLRGAMFSSCFPCAALGGICAFLPFRAVAAVQSCPRLVENSAGRLVGFRHLAHKRCTPQPGSETA